MTIDVERMRADMAAGTPGPWPMKTVRTSCGACHKVGPWPHKWRHGADMSACIYDDYPSPPDGTDAMLANARRIARVPDLEAAYLALAEENARLRDALEIARYVPNHRAVEVARATLGEPK